MPDPSLTQLLASALQSRLRTLLPPKAVGAGPPHFLDSPHHELTLASLESDREVCGLDPSCCSGSWDAICVQLAEAVCDYWSPTLFSQVVLSARSCRALRLSRLGSTLGQ